MLEIALGLNMYSAKHRVAAVISKNILKLKYFAIEEN